MQVQENDGRCRPLGYGDVAILCRASSSFEAYENALERAGIPFLTVAGRGFYGRPEVRDLLNALSALADPSDDVAMAGLLRSPAIALTDASLYRLRLAGALADAGRLALGRLRRLRRDLTRAGSRPRPPGGVARGTPARPGGPGPGGRAAQSLPGCHRSPRGAAGRGAAAAARNVAKLLADAHEAGIVSVAEFLEYVAALRDSEAREGEARAVAEGVAQIMSVHAAKGLEWPVVVIGDANYQRSGSRQPPFLHPRWGLLLGLKDEAGETSMMYRLAQREEAEREEAEVARLLYVASTRARERLILSSCVSVTAKGAVERRGGWLAGIVGPDGAWPLAGLGDLASDLTRTVDLPEANPVARCTIYGSGWSHERRAVQADRLAGAGALEWPALPADTGIPGMDAQNQVEAAVPARVWRVVPSGQRPRAPAWVVGSLVHDALAQWYFPDPDGSFAGWATGRARGYGLADEAQLVDAVAEAARLLRRFRAGPLYAEMDAAGRRLHEVPYSLATDGGAQNRVIDALYLSDGRWTIVEFKTDDIRDENGLREMLAREDYLAQARGYAAAVARLLNVAPRALLCLLNYAGTVRVEEVV